MNVVKIETVAMSRGSRARNEAYTKSNTNSAAAPASRVSTRTLVLSCSPPADSRV